MLVAGLPAHAGTDLPAVQSSPSGFDAGITWHFEPAYPCVEDSLFLVLEACRCNVVLDSASVVAGGGIRVAATIDTNHVCVQCDEHALRVNLGAQPAGTWQDSLHLALRFAQPGGGFDSSDRAHRIQISVSSTCTFHDRLPFGTAAVGLPGDCDTCATRYCEGDSIPVLLQGRFPDGCTRVGSVRVFPVTGVLAGLAPDTVRVVYERRGYCGSGGCALVSMPWRAEIKIGPLPAASAYGLRVEGYEHLAGCADSIPRFVGGTTVPFSIAGSCANNGGDCFNVAFQHRVGGCDDTYAPEKMARGTLLVRSTKALRRIAGFLHVEPPALRVREVKFDEAGGFRATWTSEGDGIRFELVAPSDTVLPRRTGIDRSEAFLGVVLEEIPGVSLPAKVRVVVDEAHAWDADGVPVPSCTSETWSPPKADLALCLQNGCDWNADGATDARDLALLADCLSDSTSACHTSDTPLPVCTRVGTFDAEDLYCCLEFMASCEEGLSAPGSSESSVRIRAEPPEFYPDLIRVPLVLETPEPFGAAILQFLFPADRYGHVNAGARSDSGLMSRSSQRGNSIKVAVAPVQFYQNPWAPSRPSGPIPLIVDLPRLLGAPEGGVLTLVGAQVSGRDGQGYEASIPPLLVPLGESPGVALESPRPNPFRGETAFSLTVASPSDVSLTIYDLAGRRVATVFRGRVEAGTTPLVWHGTRDDGTRARSGAYFYSTEVNGTVTRGKVFVLPAP